ncbi:MAG: hypothetical protein OXQ29_19950 [Rhodospirillaceae bacterium]|nr:hypothetical protein [Rhodospirillaceae bacterium]
MTIGSETYSHDVSDFLRNAVWGVRLDSGMLRVTEREHDLGRIESPSLHQLGLFDHIEMSQGIGIQFTTQLTAGAEADLRPVYPFKIQTTQFSDNYNAFAVLDENDTVVLAHGLLRTRDFQFFEYGGNHYLIFVSRAVHNDPGAAPWAVFGFAQVSPILRLDQPVEQ